MSVVQEVREFARDYINIPMQRTPARNAKIREAYKLVTGRKLNRGCSTCLIEAVIKILNFEPMATSKYEIRKGAVVQVFGHPEMAVTNNTITDEKGDWYVRNHPEKLVYFVRYPKTVPPVAPPPEVKEVVKEEVKKEVPVEATPLQVLGEMQKAQEVVKEAPKRKRSVKPKK